MESNYEVERAVIVCHTGGVGERVQRILTISFEFQCRPMTMLCGWLPNFFLILISLIPSVICDTN